MRVLLQIQTGDDAGKQVELKPGQVFRVGRFDAANLVVRSDPLLSNTHFALECHAAGCRLRDLGSRFGTLLNKQQVTEADLHDGDWIQAGQTIFLVRLEKAGAAPAPAPGPAAVPTLVDLDLDEPAPPPAPKPAAGPATPHEGLLRLLRQQTEPLYALLDGARDNRVYALLGAAKEEYQSLYEGPQGERLALVAPYLVRLPPASLLLEAVVRQGWGQSWGVYLTCRQPFKEVRRHFRQFLLVKTEAGEELYFRFYDPRVLRAFLPTCLADEAARFFGPVQAFLVEAAEPASLYRFTATGQGVRRALCSLVHLEQKEVVC
jgi:hypothetical protein